MNNYKHQLHHRYNGQISRKQELPQLTQEVENLNKSASKENKSVILKHPTKRSLDLERSLVNFTKCLKFKTNLSQLIPKNRRRNTSQFTVWDQYYPNFYTLLFHFHQEALQFFFVFCHKGGVVCVSEVIDISPGNLESGLCFTQPGISHAVFCIKVK